VSRPSRLRGDLKKTKSEHFLCLSYCNMTVLRRFFDLEQNDSFLALLTGSRLSSGNRTVRKAEFSPVVMYFDLLC
jgi:hypothetical protein